MDAMEAWGIISANMHQLYATRESLGLQPYSSKEIEAEVACFAALKEMQKREDDCK